jgi:hypothetical protein
MVVCYGGAGVVTSWGQSNEECCSEADGIGEWCINGTGLATRASDGLVDVLGCLSGLTGEEMCLTVVQTRRQLSHVKQEGARQRQQQQQQQQ